TYRRPTAADSNRCPFPSKWKTPSVRHQPPTAGEGTETVQNSEGHPFVTGSANVLATLYSAPPHVCLTTTWTASSAFSFERRIVVDLIRRPSFHEQRRPAYQVCFERVQFRASHRSRLDTPAVFAHGSNESIGRLASGPMRQ